jgi:hypothetical protein
MKSDPAQVVELPREDPGAALRLFAGIPGLRVLVVGGDGTVGCAAPTTPPLASSGSSDHYRLERILACCCNWLQVACFTDPQVQPKQPCLLRF